MTSQIKSEAVETKNVVRSIAYPLFCLFDLLLYIHGKQLRSCQESGRSMILPNFY